MAKSFVTNICGTQSKSDLSKVGNSQSVNMYPETTDANQNYVTIVQRSINGMESFVSIEGTPRGMFTVSRGSIENNYKPNTYCVFDNKLYLIINKTPYEIGELAQSSNVCHFCETQGEGGVNPHLIVVDGINVYAVDTTMNIGDQIMDFRKIKLPTRQFKDDEYIQPTHCAYLYNYLIVNDAGTDAFYRSYLAPFASVYAPSDLYDLFELEKTANKGRPAYSAWQPDNTLAIVSNGTRLFTFGDKSYQVFQYNESSDFPFTSPDTAAKLIGIKAVNSLAQLGEYTLWLGSADLGNNGIYLNTGNVDSQRVSTTDIEREIASLGNITDATSQIWQENQHIFYSITFPSANKTFVYDLKENAWHERCSLDEKNRRKQWRYDFATLDANGELLYATNGAVVKQSNKSWKEHDGRPMLRMRKGGVIYSNYSNFYIDAITVEMNNGQYKNTKNEDQYVSMRYTADGSDWTDTEIVNVGSAGSYDYDCTFYHFGMARTFTIELSTTCDFPFSLYGLKMTTSECKW